jgi:hypothetical protein
MKRSDSYVELLTIVVIPTQKSAEILKPFDLDLDRVRDFKLLSNYNHTYSFLFASVTVGK